MCGLLACRVETVRRQTTTPQRTHRDGCAGDSV
jgi:hypothetical protein